MIVHGPNYSTLKTISIGANSDLNYSLLSAYTNSTNKGDNLYLTQEALVIFAVINTWGFSQCVTILGLFANALNIMTFVKEGVKDSVNISLLGLTISDFGSLVFHFLINLCWTPSIVKLDLPFYPVQFAFLIAWGHIVFTRVTTGTTAWITFERCVCIVAPLKVKSIITPSRTVTFIVVLYVIMAGTILPIFYTTRLTLMFVVERNRSVYIVTKIADKEKIESFSYWSNNLIPTFFFILIVIFTTILVKALRTNSKWWQKTKSKLTGMSTRETKVSKTVLIISSVFILCYFPGALVFLFMMAYPSFKYGAKSGTFLSGLISFTFFLEGINASVNFFIYLAMSSKFKSALKAMLFSCKSGDNTNESIGIKLVN